MIRSGRSQRQLASVQMMLGKSTQSPHMQFGPSMRAVLAYKTRTQDGEKQRWSYTYT